jgi:hypothetical protein
MNDKNNKTLHGNSAKIDPKKPIIPLFSSVTGEYKTDSQGRRHHRHDDEEYADFIRNEVDSIRL